uniref:hypothetical protein n=1 Tax=Spirosoma sp. TaxID=1899569 RepID=UPI003B3B70C9
SWVSLLVLHSAILLLLVMYGGPYTQADFAHNPLQCTYYCETSGCTHRLQNSPYHFLLVWQIDFLNAFSRSYTFANIAVYWGLIAGFWLIALTYLLNVGKATWVKTELLVTILLAAAFGYWLLPAHTDTLFKASVFFCLHLSRLTGYSLYDVYLTLFGFVLPIVTIGLASLMLIKHSWCVVKRL